VEALVRWQHPTRGRLEPDQFVGLAEETGLIVPLGSWILEHACLQLRRWEIALPQPPYVSVNVSVRQLHEPDFPHDVASLLARTTANHHLLVLEITEGMLAADREAVLHRLRMLKQLGVRIAIDDFGTGYSSLSQLQQLPIDIVKVDKSFIDELHLDAQKANLVEGIIGLGASLHLDVVAEGIEHLEQADRLSAMNSRLGQGFLYSPPMGVDSISTLLQTRHHENPNSRAAPGIASTVAPGSTLEGVTGGARTPADE
jgi:EAL domain-containing protein (putative c-di-GMP-specific phosphodiesterase class I)